jgi:trans-aconitate methyltransferase
MTIRSYLLDLKKIYNPNAILDIGAHSGEFSKLCNQIWPDSKILMIEGNENCEPD